MIRIGALVLVASLALAQHQPLESTYISAAEIDATIQSAPEGRVSDQQIRMVDVGGTNIGAGIVQRPPSQTLGAIQHHNQAEVYRIVSGVGTLVTGGELTDGRALDPEGAVVRTLTGPSSVGSIAGGTSQRVGPGDVVIIPAGVAHGFGEITETITYLVIRIDPDQLVELKPN